MKKIAVILGLLLAGTGIAFAGSGETAKVNSLIDEGLFTHESAISQAAAALTDDEKNAVYEDNKKQWWPFALNLGIGYGVGSYVQGDTKFAVASTIIDASCDAAVFFCYMGIASQTLKNRTSSGMSYEQWTDQQWTAYAPWVAGMCAAAGVSTVWRVIETVRPFTYAKQYNAKLRDSLNSNDVSFMVLPSLSPDNSMQLAAVCKVDF